MNRSDAKRSFYNHGFNVKKDSPTNEMKHIQARRQHPLVVNKVRPGLSVEDIDGAKPSGRGQFHTNRVTDPLMPVYSLPKYEVKPPVGMIVHSLLFF